MVKSLKDRLRHKFNVAVAEIDYQDLWQRAWWPPSRSPATTRTPSRSCSRWSEEAADAAWAAS